MTRRAVPLLRLALMGLVALAPALRAQPEPESKPEPRPPQAIDLTAAIAKANAWLTDPSETKPEALEAVVAALAADRTAAIGWMAKQLAELPAEGQAPRRRRVHELATAIALEVVDHQRATDMVFVGQYAALQPLQPFVGERFFDLLLATPPWFAFTRRVHLVAPLRELQLKTPRAERLDAVIALAEDEREPVELRRALAAMLWQWGTRQFAQAVISELQEAIAEGTAEERINTTLTLADYYTLLREYGQAARTHQAAQALSKSVDLPLLPVAWYAAACAHALNGDREHALAAIERLADLLTAPHLDRSHRIAHKALNTDPELNSLREEPRFVAALQRIHRAEERRRREDNGDDSRERKDH